MELPALDDWERTVTAVVAITVLALIARFVLLGDRVAHWDEARVGYWTLNYMQTGNYTYSPIIHGPFYHHINPILFDWFGITDATMRIAPALITGLLPLTALLFRDRLRRLEIVALALFMAVDPIFLYYSRFMRGDPLVGAFMFAGFVFLVRAIDTGRGRYVLGAAAVIALGFTTKENAFVYVMSWIGALTLVLDQRLLVSRYRDQSWVSALSDNVKRSVSGIARSASVLVVAVIEFFVIIVFFYAPRQNGVFHVPGPNGGTQATLGQLLTDPLLLFGLIEAATVGSFEAFYTLWGDGGQADHAYLPYFFDFLETIGYGSVALCLLALLGFLANRYAADRPRELITFTFLWGASSLFVYPLITDIKAPWGAVHVVLPLMVPAAVGVSLLVREGYTAVANDRWAAGSIIAVILLLVSAQIAVVGVYAVYLEPSSDDNKLVQYAQPADDFHPTIHEVERIIERNEGTDVIIYGPSYSAAPLVGGEAIYNEPSCTGGNGWFNALPLPWYLVRSNASVECISNRASLDEINDSPPVIIANANYTTVEKNGENVTVPVVPKELETRFEGYNATIVTMRTTDTEVVFLINHDRVNRSKVSAREKEARPRQRERLNFQHLRGEV